MNPDFWSHADDSEFMQQLAHRHEDFDTGFVGILPLCPLFLHIVFSYPCLYSVLTACSGGIMVQFVHDLATPESTSK